MHYNEIAYKSQTGVLPLWFNFTGDVENGPITLWPVPTTAMPIYITSNKQLVQITALTQVLVLPPGYKRMLRYNLAKDLQGVFSAKISPIDLELARTSLGSIKRTNITPQRADFDPALTNGSNSGSRLGNFIAGIY